MATVQGKIWQVKINDTVIRCQTDATLNLVTNTSEVEACKPIGGDEGDVSWVNYNVDSQGWDISFSGQAFADSVQMNQADLIDLFIDGDVMAEVDFYTNTSVKGFDGTQIITYSGQGIMTGITLNGPTTGASTYDVTIQGTGAITSTRTPITT